MSVVYKGFSFKNWQRTKSFVVTDVELVKRDIKNHIFTRRGDRVGQRGFGTLIQDLLFEPFDDDTTVHISDQVRAVIDFDPRVRLLSDDDYQLHADYDTGVLQIKVRLVFVELNLTDILDINLEFNS